MEEIKDGKYVEVSFELFVGTEEEQELMDKVSSEEPLRFLYNKGQMLESFEAKLAGVKCGEKFDIFIPATEGFGEYDEERVQQLDKQMFSIEGEFDAERIFVGNTVPMMDELGNRYNGTVLEVTDETVSMDFNHPLAGEDLRFVGEVLVVRDATPEELAPAHGCGGGCSCGEGDCCDSEGGCGCN